MFLPRPIAAAPARRPVGASSAFGPTDFTYLGAYQQPDSSYWYARYRMAVRHVGGQRRLLVCGASNAGLSEWDIAAAPVQSVTEGALPAPVLITSYATFTGAAFPDRPPEAVTDPSIWGICWSEEEQRLYWAAGVSYVQAPPQGFPSFGYVTLSGGTSTGFGPWGVASQDVKPFMGGPCVLPADFATTYTAGRRLGLGWGGYYSLSQTAIAGLALCAVDRPDEEVVAPEGTYPATVLAKYGTFTDGDGLTRAERADDYENMTETGPSFQPAGGVGRWTNDGIVQGAGCWIDAPSGKSGVVVAITAGHGEIHYNQAGYYATEGSSHYWHTWTAASLGAVANGSTPPTSLATANRWRVEYPVVGYTGGRYEAGYTGPDGGRYVACSLCYDPVESRLYVFVPELFEFRRGIILVYGVT